MMMQKLKPFLKCERGTQMIEFALLLPFLILLFASTVEMGRMFYTYTTLQKSTEVGARYLSTKFVTAGTYATADTDKAISLVVCGKELSSCSGQPAVANNLTAANVTITPPGTGIGTRYVTVTVTYAYQPLVFDLGHLTGASQLSLNFTFTPSIKMRYML
jgi:Flp pilus assembly protein TadG